MRRSRSDSPATESPATNGTRVLRLFCCYLIAALLSACERPVSDDDAPSPVIAAKGVAAGDGNLTLRFALTNADTRSAAAMAAYCSRLNVMLFNQQGERVFEKVITQTKDDSDFGTLSLQLSAGGYTVVAVAHSSAVSATINSPTDVRFTAKDGKKLTDTFCHCSEITVSDASPSEHSLTLHRATAMVQFFLTDEDVPLSFARLKMEYTGGSANFSPRSLQGITKSTQSETRISNGIQLYQAFTFPYLSDSGLLRMTLTATASDGSVIRSRTFDSIPVVRNRITTYEGPFFSEGDGRFSQSDFSFLIHADWEGDTIIYYNSLTPNPLRMARGVNRKSYEYMDLLTE